MTQVLIDDSLDASTRSAHIERRLSGAWRREIRFVLARGLCRMLVWAAAMVALDFLLDWQIELPARARMGLLAVNALVLAAVAYLDVIRYLKGFDALRVALQVERLHPQLQSLLVSYVQLHDRPEGYAGTSPALVRAMCREAAQQVKSLDFGKIVRFRTLRKLLLVTVLVLAGEAAAGAWQPDFLWTFVNRFFQGGNLKYPTQTIIDSVTPGDAFPQQGARVELALVVRGDLPRDAMLFIKQDGSDREGIRLTPVPETPAVAPAATGPAASQPAPVTRRFVYGLERVTRDFDYWFKAGDAVTDRYRITVVNAPRIRSAVKADYPAYTRQVSKMLELAGLEVLEGTKLQWQLKFDRPVKAVVMQCNPGGDVALAVSPDGLSAGSEALSADKAFSYGFQLTDREHGYTYTSDVIHTVAVKADEPPTVELQATNDPPAGTVDKTVSLAFDAADEYGLAEARIVYWMVDPGNKTPPEHLKVVRTSPADKQPLRMNEKVDWDVRKSISALKPGDVVEYCVEVMDNRKVGSLGGNVKRTEKRRLEILTNEEYDRRVEEQRKFLLDGIKDVKGMQENVLPEVLRLKTQVGGEAGTSRPARGSAKP